MLRKYSKPQCLERIRCSKSGPKTWNPKRFQKCPAPLGIWISTQNHSDLMQDLEIHRLRTQTRSASLWLMGSVFVKNYLKKIILSRPRGQLRNTPRKFSRLPQIRISLNIREIRIRFSQRRSGFFHFPIGRSTFRAKIKHAATFGGLKIRSVFHKRQSPEARREFFFETVLNTRLFSKKFSHFSSSIFAIFRGFKSSLSLGLESLQKD
jgi:hypothetical protein